MTYRQNQDIRSAVVRGRDEQVSLSPVDGWPLPLCAEIEAACPGFLLYAIQSKPKWRQAVFLYLSLMGLDRADEFLFRATGGDEPPGTSVLGDLGQALCKMGPREIVAACLGDIPNGLNAALGKLGLRPMPSPVRYQKLVGVLAGDETTTRLRAKTLTQLSHLDSDVLDSVLLVDPVGLIPVLIPRLSSLELVYRFNMTLAALRSIAGATDEALRQSLESRATAFRLHEFVQGWLPKISSLPPSCRALEEHPDFERVVPSSANDTGRRFKNCLATKKLDLLTGVWSAWIWEPGDLIVTLTEVEQGFVLSGVHGCGNLPPSNEDAVRVREILAKAGVICLNRTPVNDAVKPLLIRRWNNDFELDELEFA